METINQNQSSLKKTNITTVIISVLITTIIVGASVFFYQQNIIERLQEQLSCEGAWDDTEGCVEKQITAMPPNKEEVRKNEIIVISPKKGDIICLDQPVIIKWEASESISNIGLVYQSKNHVSAGQIAQVRPETGEYPWIPSDLPVGYDYKIRFVVDGIPIAYSEDFAINWCESIN